jgi:hypothetical protein
VKQEDAAVSCQEPNRCTEEVQGRNLVPTLADTTAHNQRTAPPDSAKIQSTGQKNTAQSRTHKTGSVELASHTAESSQLNTSTNDKKAGEVQETTVVSKLDVVMRKNESATNFNARNKHTDTAKQPVDPLSKSQSLAVEDEAQSDKSTSVQAAKTESAKAVDQTKDASIGDSVSTSRAEAATHGSADEQNTHKVKVSFDYQAEDDSGLTIAQGDIVVVLDSSDADWWHGYKETEPEDDGYFPASYIEEIVGNS